MAIDLNEVTIRAVVDTLKAEAGVQKRWVQAADLLRADGVTSDLLEKDKDFRDEFKREVIMLSFSKVEQAIMAKPQTMLSDEEKITKRWIQQQTGSRLTRVIQHVKKAEEEETMSDEDRGARRIASLSTGLRRDLSAWVDKIEKSDGTDFSAVDMVKLLKSAIAMIPADK
jgi:hypothetical protein